MAEKKKKGALSWFLLAYSAYGAIKNLGALIEYEAREARDNVARLLFLYLVAAVFAVTAWVGLQAIVVLALLHYNISALDSLITLTLLNALFLMITLYLQVCAKQRGIFSRSREIMRSFK